MFSNVIAPFEMMNPHNHFVVKDSQNDLDLAELLSFKSLSQSAVQRPCPFPKRR